MGTQIGKSARMYNMIFYIHTYIYIFVYIYILPIALLAIVFEPPKEVQHERAPGSHAQQELHAVERPTTRLEAFQYVHYEQYMYNM